MDKLISGIFVVLLIGLFPVIVKLGVHLLKDRRK